MTVAATAARQQRGKRHAAESFPQPTALLAWYDRHRRVLPWRAPPGKRTDPYRVWLSEIMLQQTTVKAVAPYYARFLARWPDVQALAAAPLDDILKAWAGLGYYARARNLHACARAVVERHGGQFPQAENELRALPGIGAYTAAAIAAIAYDAPAMPVDGNIERVIARLYAVETPLPAAKPEIARLARALTPAHRSGDFAQAMMDLGATICTPKRPACALCPWNDGCAAQQRGDAEALPQRAAEARRRAAPRRCLHRTARRRLSAGADAARTRPPWRHDRSADHGLERGVRGAKRARQRAALSRRTNGAATLYGAASPGSCGTYSRIFRSNLPSMSPNCRRARARRPACAGSRRKISRAKRSRA